MTAPLPTHTTLPEGLHHRTGLKRQGLVPTGDPVARLRYRTRNGYQECDLYRVAETRPIDREAQARARTAARTARERRRAEVTATWEAERDRLLALAPEQYRAELREAVRKARVWLADPSLVLLDTETTSLCGEVVEIAVLGAAGDMRLDTLARPSVPVSEEARRVHGITDAELSGAPTWPEVGARLAEVLRDRRVVTFNAQFDRNRVWTSDRAHGRVDGGGPGESDPARRWGCLMLLVAPVVGDWHERHREFRYPSLARACAALGVDTAGLGTHRARADAELARRLLHALAAYEVPDAPEVPDGYADEPDWQPEEAPGW